MCSFADLVGAARERDVVAIGYRSRSAIGKPGALGGGIRVNPPKGEIIEVGLGDSLVVISRS